METLHIEYSYRKSNEKTLLPLLEDLESELGGSKNPYAAIFGAIDLVTVVEIAAGFTAAAALKPLVQKYFEGLLNADAIKVLGEEHRKEILAWLKQVEADIDFLVTKATGSLRKAASYPDEEAVALRFQTGDGEMYVVLNHDDMSSDILANLPKGIVKALQFLSEIGLQDGIAFQLYFSKEATEWVYLLAPTAEGFGNYIDRYVDLRDNSVRYISSVEDFLQMFGPPEEDKYKFLVSPFIADRHPQLPTVQY